MSILLPLSRTNSNSSCSSETSWTPKRPKKRDYPPRHDYSDDEEEVPERHRCTNSRSNSRLLACPFAKNFPAKRRELRACMAGWRSIPRLKQHLTRCHSPGISCRRCYKSFETEQDLDSHSQAKKACTVLPLSKKDETRMPPSARLTLRKRTSKRDSPEQAWIKYYEIIFPGVPKELIPSPYLDITKDEVNLTRQDVARDLWKSIHNILPHIIEEETRGTVLSGSSSELATRLLSKISKTIGESLGTEEGKGCNENSPCSSIPKGDPDPLEHSTGNSKLELSSSVVHQPFKESASQSFTDGIHPGNEAELKSFQPSSTTLNMISSFSCVSDSALGSWNTLDLYDVIGTMKPNHHVLPDLNRIQYIDSQLASPDYGSENMWGEYLSTDMAFPPSGPTQA